MMNKRGITSGLLLIFTLQSVILGGCFTKGNNSSHYTAEREVSEEISDRQTAALSSNIQKRNNEIKSREDDVEDYFKDIKLTEALKGFGFKNPVMTQRLGADPCALVYNDRVYIYMTGDVLEYDELGRVKNNSGSKITKINVISSADLANWTDHGSIAVAGPFGAAAWSENAWAPAVAFKKIDGRDKFFIYFADGSNGIGVLTSDSPTGPFVDPLGEALISRNTPNCSDVIWLLDPAVLVDDDGSSYLYFGGGVPQGREENPGTGRVVKLGEDMISLEGEPVALDIPYLFEDSEINKIGDTYYYSYCTNWNVSSEKSKELGIDNADIAYMIGKEPLGPFTFQKSIFKNPGIFFSQWGNNHHCIFEFKGRMYIAYHTQMLEKRLGITGGYRSTNIDYVVVNEDGIIEDIQASEFGVGQVESLNPYERVEAETIGAMAGISTAVIEEAKSGGTGNMAVTEIQTGDWIAVYGVDFGENGAKSFTACIKPPADGLAAIQIRLDKPTGEAIGYLKIEPDNTDTYKEITADLLTEIKGVHNLVFVFYGKGFKFDYWNFN